MGSLKKLKKKMLEINPGLNINNDEVIISNLVIGRRLSKRINEEELASIVGININKLAAIEEGEIALDDPDYQRVIAELDITTIEIEETLRKNKINTEDK